MAADERDLAATPMPGGLTADALIRLGLLALLAYWTLSVVGPFLTIMLWSGVLAVALYPVFDWLALRLRSRRFAALVVTIVSVLVVVGPVAWLGLGLVTSLTALIKALDAGNLPVPPPAEAIKQWPLIGAQLYDLWGQAAANTREALADLAPHLKPLGLKLLDFLEGAGLGFLEFIVAIVVAGFLFVPGPRLVDVARTFLQRVLSDRGDEMMRVAGSTIRNVSRGVVGVALLQSVAGGIGLMMVGIPGAGLLTFIALLLGIVQIGPTIVFLPAVIWCWMTKDTTTAVLFTLYMVPVSLIDNVLRPLVMAHGLTTPLPVVVIGVFGGTIAFGLIGLFVGPIVLSVAWALGRTWMQGDAAATAAASRMPLQ